MFPVRAVMKWGFGDLVAVHSLRNGRDFVGAFRECVSPSAAAWEWERRGEGVNQVSTGACLSR